MRVERPLFFASGYRLRNMLSRLAGHRCLVLDLQQVPFLDVTGAELLDEAVGSLRHRGMRGRAGAAGGVGRQAAPRPEPVRVLRAAPVPSLPRSGTRCSMPRPSSGATTSAIAAAPPGRCAGVERALQETGALDLAATAIGGSGASPDPEAGAGRGGREASGRSDHPNLQRIEQVGAVAVAYQGRNGPGHAGALTPHPEIPSSRSASAPPAAAAPPPRSPPSPSRGRRPARHSAPGGPAAAAPSSAGRTPPARPPPSAARARSARRAPRPRGRPCPPGAP